MVSFIYVTQRETKTILMIEIEDSETRIERFWALKNDDFGANRREVGGVLRQL